MPLDFESTLLAEEIDELLPSGGVEHTSDAATLTTTRLIDFNRGPGGLPILRGTSQPKHQRARSLPPSMRAARERARSQPEAPA